jgi:hypothetical protein
MMAPFETRYCSLGESRVQSGNHRQSYDRLGYLPILADRRSSVIGLDVGRALEPVLLLRGQFHLKLCETKQKTEIK